MDPLPPKTGIESMGLGNELLILGFKTTALHWQNHGYP